jgi:VIT1/CCC1 family predicted Fe2+/Mn2+ transporter/rubrerythrin
MSKTDKNLWNAIIGEAMAMLKYNAYAAKAMEEGHPEIAQIFQETAGAENIHGINHLKTAKAVGSTLENLKEVTQGEAKEINSRYPRMIRDALDEGRRDAARAFTMAMDRERHHLDSFLKAISVMEAKQNGKQADKARLAPPRFPEISDADVAGLDIPKTEAATAVAPPSEAHEAMHVAEAQSEFPEAVREVERERWRVAAFGRIREVVFGAQDGLMSTVALVTAVGAAVAATDTTTVVIAGLAGALAGMVSMATGTYLGSKAERDVFTAEIEKEAKELEENPAEEMAELVFLYHQQGMNYHEAREMAEHIASDKDLWLRTLVEKELGIDPDLASNPIKDALTMGAAFIIGAIIPIMPYFFVDGFTAIGISVALALGSLFVLGMAKGRLVQRKPLLQGLEIMTIGAISAGLGYFLGEVIPRFVD